MCEILFNKRPCYFQIKVAQALYAGKDVVACAPTGASDVKARDYQG